jgi:hypothetical protein
MAVIYSTAAKNARLEAVVNVIDGGGITPGYLEIGTAGMATVLAKIVFAEPCGSVSGGVLTFSGFPKSDTSADATGVAAAARIRDGSDNNMITGLTVGTSGSGADIILDTTNIDAGEIVTLNSATITAN